MDIGSKIFRNADQEEVAYDGSPLNWRVSAYAFIIKDEKLLIIKNRLEKLCDIVGGGIEFGESIEEALHREALEEGGALIKIGELIHATSGWFSHRNGKFYQTLQLFYKAELIDELQQPTEADIEWREFMPLAEAGSKYRLPVVVEEILGKLK